MDATRCNRRILVTGTDRDALMICETYLRHVGYDVVTAADPERALGIARRLRPGLVITMYPTLLRSGRCVTEALREDPALSETPVLSLTSWVRVSDLDRAAAAGVTESLPIPAPLQELSDAVERLIGVRRWAPGAGT